MERYSLKCLKVVHAGMWLMLFATAGTGVVSAVMSKILQMDMTENPIPGMICGGVELLGWFLIIGGLSSAKRYSDRFRKARNQNIWAYIFSALAIVLIIAILVSFTSNEVTKLSGTLGVAAVIGAIVLLVLAGLFRILYVKNLMGGCGAIAKENDDRSYARKCTVTWVLYLLGVLTVIGSAVLLLYVFGKALLDASEENGGQINSFEDLKVINDDVTIVGFVFIGALIFGLIIYFMQMARVNGTYRRFHGEIIPGQEEPEPITVGGGGAAALDTPAVEPAVLSEGAAAPSFFDPVSEGEVQTGPALDFGAGAYADEITGQSGPQLDFGGKETDTITLTDIKE